MKRRGITEAEARELTRRHEDVRRKGGASLEVIRQDMLADMDKELRAMIAQYDGSPVRAKKLLESLVIAEEEGLKSCAELRRRLAEKTRSLRAA